MVAAGPSEACAQADPASVKPMNDLGDPGSINSPTPRAPLPQGLVLPAYGGPCLSSLVPALLEPPGERAGWLPPGLNRARQVALLVLDGLGWDQLQERRHLVPVLAGMAGGPISSVAPTTTAVALCSLTLGMTPAAHGVLGYKLAVAGPDGPDVLNVLRWTTRSGNARQSVPPGKFQPRPAFRGRGVPVVTRVEFRGSGFSEAHQSGGRELPWVVSSSLPLIVRRELARGEELVYAYYDGIDRIAHTAGLGELYEAELAFVDSLVSGLASVLPSGAALAVVSDHGQMEVGEKAEGLSGAVMAEASMVSGEGRFRWLHARRDRAAAWRLAAWSWRAAS